MDTEPVNVDLPQTGEGIKDKVSIDIDSAGEGIKDKQEISISDHTKSEPKR